MLSKQFLLLVFLVVVLCQYVFCGGTPEKIKESDIPPPETHYELPENLVGDFVLAVSWIDRGIQVFPNNKFITWQKGNDHGLLENYGYVVKRESSWYLMPVKSYSGKYYRQHPFLSDSSDFIEITMTDTGFSFYDSSSSKGLNVAIPKSDINEARVAEDVSVLMRRVRQQYYFFEQSNTERRIDFYNIINSFPSPYHTLEISNGIVTIWPVFDLDNGSPAQYAPQWEGFLEKADSTINEMQGTIRFTNGPPHYFVKDGIAMLVMKDDIVTLTMQCTSEVEEKLREKHPEVQSPVFLVLEF